VTVYWPDPLLSWDFRGDGARTMMLVYNLPATAAVNQRSGGIAGTAYSSPGLAWRFFLRMIWW